MNSHEIHDRDLWRDVIAGSGTAFSLIFDRYKKDIYNYCFRRTADWSLAEDLTSVVFLEAWRKRTKVRVDARGLRPWLFGVATNVIRNQQRSVKRYRSAVQRLSMERAAESGKEAADRASDEETMRAVSSRSIT